ncbi:MAG: TspO/MBR family protein [Chitinophagaceae bacterium]
MAPFSIYPIDLSLGKVMIGMHIIHCKQTSTCEQNLQELCFVFMKQKVLYITLSVLFCVILGSLGGLFTISEIKGWYSTIQKPSWNPPNWIFGPVWTTLYTLMGISFGLILSSKGPEKKKSIQFFVTQFLFNLLWSYIFFNQHMIGLAFLNILLMLTFILLTIFSFNRISKLAAILLIPYVSWVSFAAILNFTIYRLNP